MTERPGQSVPPAAVACRGSGGGHLLSEEMPLRCDADGVEALLEGLCATDQLHLVALSHVLLDHAGYCEDAEPRLPKDLRQRGVIQLTDDLGPDVLGSEPLLQQPTEHRVA